MTEQLKQSQEGHRSQEGFKYNQTYAIKDLTNENFEDKVWERGNVTVIFGGQQGDEGKGKVTSQFKNNDRVAVATGGGNAGHQVICKNGKKIALHELPGGAVNEKAKIYIGQGRVVNIKGVYKEIIELEDNGYNMKNKTFIAGGAQIIFDNLQKKLDKIIEGLKTKKVGTTAKGIGPAYAIKALRIGPNFNILLDKNTDQLNEFMKVNSELFQGLDLEEIMDEIIEDKKILKKMIDEGYIQIDTSNMLLNEAAYNGEKILIEHSQSSGLGIDGGNYPYCTSSDTSSNGVCSGLNLPEIHTNIMVTKSIKSKVGGGYFPTKFDKEKADEYRNYCGDEVGATSGRTRDVGYYDMVELKETSRKNKVDILYITKFDLLNILRDKAKIGEIYINKENGKIYINQLPKGSEYEDIEVKYGQNFDLSESILGTKEKSELPQNYIDYTDHLIEALGFEGNVILGTGMKGEDYIVYK